MKKDLIQLLSRIAPAYMEKKAYHYLTHPQIHKLRPHESEVLERAETTVLPFEGFDIQTYHWPGRGKQVLLVHGWEGQAGNFSDLIDRLEEHGFDIWAFDAPSHGFSSKGETSLFEFTDLVRLLIQRHAIRYLVSHSFGGVACTYALAGMPGWKIQKYALLTTPDTFRERVDFVSAQVGITDKVKQRLIARFEAEVGQDIDDMRVSRLVTQIQVEQALILHDENDRILPIDQSMRVHRAWQHSELRIVEGTGHFRILRTPAVLDQVIDFLQS